MKQHSASNFDELDDSSAPLSAASAAGIFAEGSRFGTYVIGPCIGHGGMARIYRAEHEGLRRQVALKVLTSGVANGSEGRARFLREARIAAAIKHPNVVNIFDIGIENRVPYLVMELLVGQDLDSLLHSTGALSESTIIDMAIPVVAGLVAVHDAGVVHSDLKPGNIFLSRGPNDEVEPKLLDFGISKANGGEKLRRTSVTRELLMGTPLYMSPEALLGADMTVLSDQYSLGVMLYECCTGINPFMADSVAETARRVTSGEYPPLSEQPIRPSKRLASIIERAMSLEPLERYPNMRAMGRDLLALAGQRTRITWALTFGEVAGAARAEHVLARGRETPAAMTSRQLSSKPPSNPWRWAALGMFAALVAVALSMVSSRQRDVAFPFSDASNPVTRVELLRPEQPAGSVPRAEPARAQMERGSAGGAAAHEQTRSEPAGAAAALPPPIPPPTDVELIRRSEEGRSPAADAPRSRRARSSSRAAIDLAHPEWELKPLERQGFERQGSSGSMPLRDPGDARLGPNQLELGTNRAPIFD